MTVLPTHVRWKALGTYAFLATGEPGLLSAAERLARGVLAEVDRACSRFRSDSDLTRANAAAGSWVRVDPLLVAAAQVAVQAARETGGLVDPCLGRVLVGLGYDADLAEVRRRPPLAWGPPPAPPPSAGAWRRIGLDPEGWIRVPAGSALDLGATGKAWASDLVAAAVVEELGCDVVVSLGGDIRIDGPDGSGRGGWPVTVGERPDDPSEAELVWLGGGGLATSSTVSRRWRRGAGDEHHLLDPATGRPTREVWRTATATGSTCVAANTATTAALVLGDGAVEWLEAHDVSARLVAADGSVTRVGRWPVPEERST